MIRCDINPETGASFCRWETGFAQRKRVGAVQYGEVLDVKSIDWTTLAHDSRKGHLHENPYPGKTMECP